MLFDPPAAEWVFNYCANNNFVTWQDFLDDVRHRFDRQSFKNYFALLAKLTQTGTVVEYHDTFERYLNRVQGVPESELFTLFVAGLKPDMQERLHLHRPSSLAAAMALVLELVDSQPDRVQQPSTQRRPLKSRDNRGQPGINSSTPPAQLPAGSSQPQGTSGRAAEQQRRPLIRVSQAERAERARLGLCYYCPDKWVAGHVCKQRLLCYAYDGDFVDVDALDDFTPEEPDTTEFAHVHAMHRGQRSRPLRVVGLIQDREVNILIDTRSDRDLLHPQIAEALHLPLSPIRPFKVLVGNGAALLCTHIARQTELKVQGSIFRVDLHILPIHGPDIILGMDWLESLGKVTADFVGKTLEFTHEDRTITLKGILPPPRSISLQSLFSLGPARDSMEFYEVLLLQPDQQTARPPEREEFTPDLPPGVIAALEKFHPIFSLPERIPPK